MGKSVLVIEDEPAQRSLIREVLQPHGYELFEAENGEAAIRQLVRADFNAILLDLRMPGGSGEFVVQWILANRPYLKPRVLVVTGDVLSRGAQAFLNKVQLPLLAKPYNVSELVKAVEKMMGGEPDSGEPKNEQ